jgi:hypothetical protein
MAGKNKKTKPGGDAPVAPRPGDVVATTKKAPNYDLSGPGAGEKAYADYGSRFFDPGQAQGFYEQNKGAYSTPGQGENVSKQVADDFQRGSQGESAGQDYWQGVNGKYGAGGPGYSTDAYSQFDQNVGADAGLDAYYDAAFAKTSRQLDRASAARGQFNSSEAMRGQRDASVALNAEQANREADFRLRSQQLRQQGASAASADELGWTQGMGQLAFGAADERLRYGESAAGMASNAQQLGMDRLASGYNAAMGIDQYNVGSAATGMGMAFDAQAAREGRIQGMFNNQLAIGDRVSGAYGSALERDAEYAQQQTGTAMGSAKDDYNVNQQQQQQRQARNDAVTAQMTQFFSNYASQQGGGQARAGTTKKEP